MLTSTTWLLASMRHIWDKAFIGGSLTAAFFLGVMLGAYIDGIKALNRAFAGGPLDWLQAFPPVLRARRDCELFGAGSTWRIMKTEGALHRRMVHLTGT